MTSLSKRLTTALIAALAAACLVLGLLFSVALPASAEQRAGGTVSLVEDDLSFSTSSDGLEKVLTGLSAAGKTKVASADYFTFTLPADVTEIKGVTGGVFGSDSVKLKAMNAPGNSKLTKIGTSAFSGCSALESVTIPENVTSIGSSAFSGCTGLTDIKYYAISCDLSATASSFGHPFLSAGQSGAGITLTVGNPDGSPVEVIPANMFNVPNISGRANLNKIVFEHTDLSVSGFGASAFANCINLVSVESKDLCKVFEIGSSAFSGCTSLSEISLPSDLNTISRDAFKNCASLTTIVIPSGVGEISEEAFAGCNKLVEVRNLSNVISLTAGSAAYGKIAQNAISVLTSENTSIGTVNGFKFMFDGREGSDTSGKNLLVGYTGTNPEIVLPAYYDNQGYEIYDYALSGNKTITKVTVAEGCTVTRTGSRAFENCTSLVECDLTNANKLDLLGDNMFSGCSSLVSVKLPDSVTNAGTFTFYNCESLTNVVLSAKLEKIGMSTFSGCKALTSFAVPENVTEIDSLAFTNSGLESIEIPANVTVINSSAFSGCASLAEISFAEDCLLGSIGANAFSGTALEMIVIPDTVTSIDNSAFANCQNLSTVYLPAAANYGINLFEGCLDNLVIISDSAEAYAADYAALNNESRLTYVIELNLVYGGTSVTEEALFGYAYGYTHDDCCWYAPDKKDLMPVQNGYSYSVWYLQSDCSGGALTAETYKTVAGATGLTKLSLYAVHVEKPVKDEVEITYDPSSEIEADIDGINSLLPGGNAISEYVTAELVSYKDMSDNSASELPFNIKNAGTYTFKLSLKEGDEYSLGKWAEDYTFTVHVDPLAFDLYDYENFRWVLTENDVQVASLSPDFDGETQTLYIYNGIPYLSVQDDLGGYMQRSVKTSYVRYNGKERTVMIESDANVFIVVGEYIDKSQTAVGSYTTKAVIKPANNYSFTLGLGDYENANLRGISFIYNYDGTYTASKTWYIVASDNPVLAANKGAYTVTDWTYNDVKATLPAEPQLQFGDANELMTFTLTLDGVEVIEDAKALSEFKQYFNLAMPAGSYVLTLHVKEEVEDGEVYPAFEKHYRFTVRTSNLMASDIIASADKIKGGNFSACYNGEAQFYDPQISLDIPGAVHPSRTGTAWEDEKFNKYYGEFEITYNLTKSQSNHYHSATELANPENISDGCKPYAPVDPDRYTVYFQISAPGYTPLVDLADLESINRYSFNLLIYDVIAAPELDNVYYSGDAVYPSISADRNYKVIWLDNPGEYADDIAAGLGEDYADDYVNAGIHKYVLRLDNPAYYYWDSEEKGVFGEDNRYCVFEFEVLPAENSQTYDLNLIRWTYGEYDSAQNVAIWGTKFGSYDDYTYELKLVGGTDKDVYRINAFVNEFGKAGAGTYTFTATATDEAGNWLPISASITVEILPAVNYWSTVPNIDRWAYGTFETSFKTPVAIPHFGSADDVKFYYYLADDDDNPIVSTRVESIEEFFVDNEVPGGRYVLEVVLDAGENSNYSSLDSFVPFSVMQTDNYWIKMPAISDWIYGGFKEYSTVSEAIPRFGSAGDIRYEYYRCGADGTPDVSDFCYDLGDWLDEDGELPAGNYLLKVSLDGNSSYSAMHTLELNFSVLKLANRWTVTPNVIQWNYGEYDRGENLVNAVAEYGTTEFEIYVWDGTANNSLGSYNIVEYTTDDGKTVTSFRLDGKLVPEYVAKKLKTLEVNEYYLLAKVESGASYSGINDETVTTEYLHERTMQFSIDRAKNYWYSVPNIIGWSEGHFNKETNSPIAIAEHGSVVITIADEKGNVIITNADGQTLDLDKLAKLSVGNYTLYANVEATGNYDSLDAETTFAVFEDSVGVSGIIATTIVFAVIAVVLAVAGMVLMILRRRKIEAEFRKMVKSELDRR